MKMESALFLMQEKNSLFTPTIISMELQREVPQYMAIPWLITWVIARTVSANQNINNQSPNDTQTLRDRGTKSDAVGMR